MTDIEANEIANETMEKLGEIPLTDWKKQISKLSDKVAKMVLVKLLRKME